VRFYGASIEELLAFPYQRLVLETPLPVVDVIRRIEQAVEPRRLWRFSRTHRDFEGMVSRGQFKIMRVIHYRNSFRPVIAGVVKPRLQGGTRVELTMRLNRAVAAFMMLWAAAPLGITLYFSLFAAAARQKFSGLLFFVAAMLGFAYILCAGGFNVEARRALDRLKSILDLEQEQTANR
jgi:hypothetical protein